MHHSQNPSRARESKIILCTSRVCLFGGEIRWKKIFKKKMGRKTFLERVWMGGEKGK